MSGSFHIDDSRWPISVFTVEGMLDDAQLEAYITEGTRRLERGQPYVVIMDIRRMGRVSAYSRARNTQFAEANREKLRARCLGTAYVITSPLLRFITMTALLLARLPMPYVVCADLDEALAWAHKRVAQRGWAA
nr:hypothetical protein Hi04_10k_c3807_00020 [uncultured bacterium]